MEFSCRLKSCAHPHPLSSKSARVEVKSALPRGGLRKVEDKLAVRWKKNGEAVFHPACWQRLTEAASQQKRKKRVKKKTVKKDKALGMSGASPTTRDNLGAHVIECERVMIQEASKTEEIFDSEEDVKEQAKRVALMIKSAKHCVFFTGAGISTAAGLGDFRGKGGKWTEEDRETVTIDDVEEEDLGPPPVKRARSVGKKNASSMSKNQSQGTAASEDKIEKEREEDDDNGNEELDYEHLRPTFTHEAIRRLVDDDHIKYLISQNCDGLHCLSGVPSSRISELHGNVFNEKCEKCGAMYSRPYYVCDDIGDMYLEEVADFGKSTIIAPKFMKKCRKCGLSHRTGRQCDVGGCGGQLIDTIINFCDDLEADILDKAFASAKSCDLLVCLGTTLTVTPACNIVHHIKKPRRIVICNRQVTEKDEESLKLGRDGTPLGARIHGDCDVFMTYVMKNVMGEEAYDAFVASLPERKAQYDEQRSKPSVK
ncbi:NAD-dependent protein deacetylase SRT1 [Aplysia californica]|uniref:protein acetyllysine N-acetyltransferase n=1 Tax=Aplysia californica TaxID=6500 RepID=A0ABM0JIT9_APLCA|nr:NAD-dependent protein deacetylase SRT1 [Aplysia californica]